MAAIHFEWTAAWTAVAHMAILQGMLRFSLWTRCFVLSAATAVQTPDHVRAVDEIFEWTSANTPGCAIAAARDGKPILARAYGTANLSVHAPVTIETVFDAGSIAKQFTAAAIMLLANDGKLSLDDPIHRYLPELKDYGTPVTIRNLLAHTSGIRDFNIVSIFSGFGVAEAAYSVPEVLERVARQASVAFRPGSEYAYSSTNYILAAIIVGRLGGMPFTEFTRRRLFEPAGMARTQWRDGSARVVDRLANPYDLDGQGVVRERPDRASLYGAGGLLTTVGDLLKWDHALASGKIVPAAMLKTMETPVPLLDGRLSPSGLGLVPATHNNRVEIQHGGSTSGTRAFLARYPEDSLSVAILCNQRSVDVVDAVHRVADLFLPHKPGAPPADSPAMPMPKGVQLDPPQLSAAAGLYRSLRTGEAVRLTVKDGRWEFSGDVWFGRATLIPVSPRAFAFGTEGAAQGEFIAFERDAVKAFTLRPRGSKDSITYERVAEWKPSAEQLREFAGRYVSEELSNEVVFGIRSGRLWIQPRPGRWMQPGVVLYRDAFDFGPLGMLNFERDGEGRITNFRTNHPMARGLVFQRK